MCKDNFIAIRKGYIIDMKFKPFTVIECSTIIYYTRVLIIQLAHGHKSEIAGAEI